MSVRVDASFGTYAATIATDIWEKGLDPSLRTRLDPGAEELYRRGMDFAEREGRRAAEGAITVDAVVTALEHALSHRAARSVDTSSAETRR